MCYDNETHHTKEKQYEKLSPIAKLFGIFALGLLGWVVWGMLHAIYSNLMFVWGK